MRELMPLIEQKLACGVRLAQIVGALNSAGIAVSMATLKSVLYQERKKAAKAAAGKAASPTGGLASSVSHDTKTAPAAAPRTSPYVPPPAAAPTKHVPPTPQQLHAILHPDPVKQAEEMAEYERIAREAARAKRLAQKQNAG